MTVRLLGAILVAALAAGPLAAAASASAAELPPETATLLAAAAAPDADAAELVEHVRGLDEARQRAFLEHVAQGFIKHAAPAVRERVADAPEALWPSALKALRAVGLEPADLAMVRQALERATDPQAMTFALLILGDLGDLRSAPMMIARITHENATVAGTAVGALERLSGRKLGRSPEAWQAWYEATEKRADELLPQLSARLLDRDAAVVKAAILRLSILSDHRAEALELVTPLTEHADAEIAGMAREAMRKLGGKPPAAPAAQRKAVAPVGTVVGAAPATTGRPLADSLGTLVLVALVIGVVGAVVVMVFLMRTREVAIKATKRLTRRVSKATQAIKKKITFTS